MEQNSLKAEEFYANPNPWMRETSSEVPRTEAFTESLRGTPHIDPRASCPQDSEMSGTGGQRLIHNVTLATRPGSSGATSTSGLDVIGRDVKELMDGIQSLRHLGFETSVVPLPKIVVVGDQSTGKSSVIEGISGIKVPRNVGTCTRCPLEINLTNSQSPWQCRVFLSRRFAYAPQQFGRTVTKARPFGCWEPLNAPEEYAFAVLDSKEAVATTLLLAQLATLNPGMNYEVYQAGNDGVNVPSGTMQCEFSPNVVRLDISGPGLPNLAFYDLPGMISHVAHDNQSSMPKLVENLVREYIKSENTIILLTLTMNHDLQNSKAAGFISKTKSDGKSRKADDRTVGVLTKPDLISPDSEESFVKIFLGEDFKRRLGYFVVKNNHNPAVSHSVARNEELRFFEEWPQKYPGLGRFKDRFGTLKLQEELSRLLADLIRESLPTIRETAKDKIREFEEHCSSLPKPPSGNLSLEIHNVIVTLCRQLEGMFNQLPGDANSEMARFQKTARDFRKRLVDSYPRLKSTITNSEPMNQDVGSPLPSRQTAEFISIDDDDEDMTPVTPSRPPTNHASLARKRQLQHERQAGEPKRARLDSAQPEPTHPEAKIFTLEELHELITNRDDTGLTGPINPVVTKEIFLLSNDHWRQVVSNFVTQTLRLVGDAIIEQARRCFHAQVETALWKKIHSIIKSYIENLFQDVAAFAMRCLKMEKSVFTMDRTAVEPSRKRALEAMLADRRVERANRQIEEEERNGRNITDTVKSNRRLQARNGTGQSQVQDADVYQYELEQLATVHGYYQYAANRLCEYVVLCIRTEVFPKCTGDLCDAIKDALHLSDENANTHVRRLLEVSATVAEERARCEEQLKLLNQGLQLLRELEEGAAFSEATTTQSTML